MGFILLPITSKTERIVENIVQDNYLVNKFNIQYVKVGLKMQFMFTYATTTNKLFLNDDSEIPRFIDLPDVGNQKITSILKK